MQTGGLRQRFYCLALLPPRFPLRASNKFVYVKLVVDATKLKMAKVLKMNLKALFKVVFVYK